MSGVGRIMAEGGGRDGVWDMVGRATRARRGGAGQDSDEADRTGNKADGTGHGKMGLGLMERGDRTGNGKMGLCWMRRGEAGGAGWMGRDGTSGGQGGARRGTRRDGTAPRRPPSTVVPPLGMKT